MKKNEGKEEDKVYHPGKSFFAAVVMYFIDTVMMNQRALAFILVIIMAFWWLPKSVFLLFKKRSLREPLFKIGIYGLMAALVFSTNIMNNNMARQGAEVLVDRINQYHVDKGVYPETLQDLVPAYIEAIPAAKYTMVSGEFIYMNVDEHITFFYVHFPPFGRQFYNFDTQAWFYLD